VMCRNSSVTTRFRSRSLRSGSRRTEAENRRTTGARVGARSAGAAVPLGAVVPAPLADPAFSPSPLSPGAPPSPPGPCAASRASCSRATPGRTRAGRAGGVRGKPRPAPPWARPRLPYRRGVLRRHC
jgi:hypothetical protein